MDDIAIDSESTIQSHSSAAIKLLRKTPQNRPSSYYERFGMEDSFTVKRQFVVRLAKDLSLYGSPTHRLEFLLEQVSKCLGLDASFFVLPGMIMVTFNHDDQSHNDYGKVKTGMNFGKLFTLNNVCYMLLKGQLSISEATIWLDKIRNEESLSPYALLWIFPLFSFLICASGFGGSWIDSMFAAGFGLIVGAMQVLACFFPETFGNLNEFLSAFLATAGTNYAWRITEAAGVPLNPQKVIFSAISILLPGLNLTLSILEISTKNFVCGIVRMFSSFFTALLLGFGYSFGDLVFTKPSRLITGDAVSWEWSFLLLPILSSLICLLFEARYKQWPIMMFVACMSITAQILLGLVEPFKSNLEATIMLISLMIGIVSNIYSRITGEIAIAPVFAGILMIVPGSYGVRSTLGFIQNQTETGLAISFKMMVIAVCITVGIFFSTLVAWPFTGTRKRTLISF